MLVLGLLVRLADVALRDLAVMHLLAEHLGDQVLVGREGVARQDRRSEHAATQIGQERPRSIAVTFARPGGGDAIADSVERKERVAVAALDRIIRFEAPLLVADKVDSSSIWTWGGKVSQFFC